jgi:hypothetical protein
MTEKQWFASTDGVSLSRYWGNRLTERKARLIMIACCRRQMQYIRHPVLQSGVDMIVNHYADPTRPDEVLEGPEARGVAARVRENASKRSREPEYGVAFGVVVVAEPLSTMKEREHTFDYLVFSCLTDISNAVARKGLKDEPAAQAAIVRDVLGNPFVKPKPKIKSAWRTDTVLALAKQIYVAEEFGAMPILADALQDAGCDNEHILSHCRDTTQVHVRGCWVLDLLFDKK